MSAAVHLSLGDVLSALRKLMLANLPEFALPLAQQFMPNVLDQVLTLLFKKSAYFGQTSLTNAILGQI